MRKKIAVHFILVCVSLILIRQTASGAVNPHVSDEHRKIHQMLTQGTGTMDIGRLCPVIPQRRGMYPIVCGGIEAYTGNPLYLQGSCPPVVVAGHYGKGKVVALGNDAWLLENPQEYDTSRLAYNSLLWLIGSGQSSGIGFYTSIGALITTKTLSAQIQKELSAQDLTITDLAETISDTNLPRCSVLIITRPHARSMSADEAEAICRFVKAGGGLLMAGQAWFWAKNNPDSPMADFPLNVLGHRLGVEFLRDIVWAQNQKGQRSPATFQVHTPAPWRPKRTKVFKLEETADQKVHAFVNQHKKTHNFAIEGEHAILSLPADAFLKLHSPTKAIRDLDTVYKTHAHLAGNVPYGGDKIMFVVVDRLNFHLVSGNPVLIRKDRVPVVLNDFNELGHPGWGLIHELGHDFVASAHKHIYPLGPGDNESWANVFTLHAYDTLDLDYVGQDALEILRSGVAYYFAEAADYEHLKKDQWIMLGLLRIIQQTCGWDPFYRFFQDCTQITQSGSPPKTEQEKADFLVHELSTAAGVDLSAYFVRWGFPVSKTVISDLRILPPAELDPAAETMARQYKMPIQ